MDIPRIGLGTFGSDKYSPAQVAAAVYDAASIGYRHFDCAAVYGNEAEIGIALERVFVEIAPREEFWITTKLWNDQHAEQDVRPAFERSLRDLRLDYVDLYLIHWPFPNFHPPGCDVSSRSPDARPYIHEEYMRTWRQLEALHRGGLTKQIGTSNMTIPKLTLLLRDATVRPFANEMEIHPHFQQPELFEFVRESGMVPIGYSPLGSPSRPGRDRTLEDSVDLGDPTILRIAHRLGISPAPVCLKWAVQRGSVAIPFSVKREQYSEALGAIAAPHLSGQDMLDIAAIDRRCRLIKGQVFLWREDQDWRDLWDEDGVIRT